jgi:hypothetical protein
MFTPRLRGRGTGLLGGTFNLTGDTMSLYVGRNSDGKAEVRKYGNIVVPPKGWLTPEELLNKVERLEYLLLLSQRKSKHNIPDFMKGLFR